MRTFVTVVSDRPEVATRLQQIFKSRTDNQWQVDAYDVINNLKGTSYCPKDEKEGWDKEVDFPPNQLWDEIIGPKWMNVEYNHDELPNNCNIVLSSASHVPTEFLSTLRNELQKIDPTCYIKGTYEDESYEPCGAFVYGQFEYNEIEDTDEIYDWDEADEDDFYNENWVEQLNDMMDNLESGYIDYLEDRKNNPEDYE